MKSGIIITLFLSAISPVFWMSFHQKESTGNKGTSESSVSQNDNGGYKNRYSWPGVKNHYDSFQL